MGEMTSMEKYAAEADFSGGLYCEGEGFRLGDLEFLVKSLPGHTLGHVGFLLKKDPTAGAAVPTFPLAFLGDVLFAMGCGRLFEGTPEQGWQSLHSLLQTLDDRTIVFCA